MSLFLGMRAQYSRGVFLASPNVKWQDVSRNLDCSTWLSLREEGPVKHTLRVQAQSKFYIPPSTRMGPSHGSSPVSIEHLEWEPQNYGIAGSSNHAKVELASVVAGLHTLLIYTPLRGAGVEEMETWGPLIIFFAFIFFLFLTFYHGKFQIYRKAERIVQRTSVYQARRFYH